MKRIIIIAVISIALSVSGCQTAMVEETLKPTIRSTPVPTPESTPEPTPEPVPEPTLEPTLKLETISPLEQAEKSNFDKFKEAMANDDYDSEYHRLKDEVKIIKAGLKDGTTNGVKYKEACFRMFGDDTLGHDEVERRVKSWGNLFDADSRAMDIVFFMEGLDGNYITRNKSEGTVTIDVPSLITFADDANMSEITALHLMYALNMLCKMDFCELEIASPDALQLVLAICEELDQTYDMNGYVGEVAAMGESLHPDAEKDFRFSNWDDTIEDVKATEIDAIIIKQESDILQYLHKINDVNVVITYVFTDGKLESGGYITPDLKNNTDLADEYYKNLESELRSVYGKPYSESESETGPTIWVYGKVVIVLGYQNYQTSIAYAPIPE